MAESGVDARREARRRRILENSENRLQKIFANQSNINSVPSSASNFIAVPASEDETKISSIRRVVNGCTPKDDCPAVSISADKLNDDEADQDFISNQLLSNIQDLLQIPTSDNVASPPVENKTTSSNFQHYERFHVICLALSVRLALAFNLGYLFGEILLVPFLIVELSTKFLTEKVCTPSTGSGILQLVLLLSGIIPSRATFIIKIFNETSTLLQNMCIYLFTFVLCHAFIDWPE